MLFNSFIFFIFLGSVLPVFYLLPNKKAKNLFLVLVSYIFYGYWDWRFCFLLTLTTVVDFFVGKYIFRAKEERSRKTLLVFSLVVNLTILGFFKYFNFFAESFQDICKLFGGQVDF